MSNNSKEQAYIDSLQIERLLIKDTRDEILSGVSETRDDTYSPK